MGYGFKGQVHTTPRLGLKWFYLRPFATFSMFTSETFLTPRSMPAGRAIARSVDLVRHVEQWRYKRYWRAEHHAISGLAQDVLNPGRVTIIGWN
jgi:hypothetical protein